MNIFVGSAAKKVEKKYSDAAKLLGSIINEKGYNLVCGGYRDGLMGDVFSCIDNVYGSIIYSIVPKTYLEEDRIDLNHEKLIVTENLSETKATMEKYSDAFLFLPGGIGTFDEFFTIVALKRTEKFDKPIVLINIGGYFDSLLIQLDRMFNEGFADIKNKELYFVVNTPEEAVNLIESLS